MGIFVRGVGLLCIDWIGFGLSVDEVICNLL